MALPDISSDTPGKAPGAFAPGPKLYHPRGLTLYLRATTKPVLGDGPTAADGDALVTLG